VKIKRISFIEVKSPHAYIFRRHPIPRVGAILLATILKGMGFDTRVFVEDVSAIDWNYVERSDLVCISTITSTAARAYEIGDRLMSRGMPVAMGGAHPTFMADEALQHADYVVRGEGETPLAMLVSYLEKGTPALSSIDGLSYRDGAGQTHAAGVQPPVGSIHHNPPSEPLKNLAELPAPDFRLVHGWSNANIHPVSTTRGCAFNCRFCLVGGMFGRRYRFRPEEAVVEELARITAVSRSPVFFVDDNFAANLRRTKNILRGIASLPRKPWWSAMTRPDVARDEELMSLMAASGRVTLCIGFESINPETLKAYNKKQDVADNVHAIRALKAHGIKVHGMFVFGADTDTVDTIRRTVDFAADSGIDSVQFMNLTPLPGTKLFDEFKQAGRLLHTDWDKYDIHHVVFTPSAMSAETLHMETLLAMQKFYSWQYIARNLIEGEFFYAAFGIISKNSVKKAMGEGQDYLREIEKIQNEKNREQNNRDKQS
jgi:radical SAM superfamily enzyme YgiQ (UPF0313 family)